MALIKTTAAIDAISGKVQGSVFARNLGGAYWRGRGKVSNPRSNSQQIVRSIFGTISQNWRELSQLQREQWIKKSVDFPYQNRLGDTRRLPGKALFQKLNQNLTLVGGNLLEAPPQQEGVDGFVRLEEKLTAETDGSEVTFNFQARVETEMQQNMAYLVESTGGISPGIQNPGSRFRTLGAFTFTGPGEVMDPTKLEEIDTGEDLNDVYAQEVGDQPVGSKIFFRLHPINNKTGERGPAITTGAIVTEA